MAFRLANRRAILPKAPLNKSVRVELVETQPRQTHNGQRPSTGSGRTDRPAPRRPSRALDQPHASHWRWALVGLLCGVLGATLWWAPARWLAAGLAHASGQRVLLQDARGTLWQGSARLSLRAGPGSRDQASLPGRVQWHLGLQLNRITLALQADCCTTRPIALTVALSGAALQLAVQAPPSHWPAALLAGLGTPWNTLALQGQLQLHGTGLQLTQGLGAGNTNRHLQGELHIDALGLSSRLSTLRPLGSYRLRLHGQGLQLTTLDGPLQLSGQGSWQGTAPMQRLQFRGEASATPDKADELANLLNIIGRRDGARSIIHLG